ILAPCFTDHFLTIVSLNDFVSLPPPPLKFGGGEIAERGVPPMRVIKGLDVIEEREPRRFARRKRVPHQELRLERSEEGLGESVIVRVPDGAHRGRHARLPAPPAERQACILRA